ncbi:MAG: AMP-binding protein [Moorea sp. SIOASIH]|uniref:AMP-binding protein n=1 Tax=Moorena sp. SIOASIH TaxID=2607817 RepID=UPI0013BAB109|nr:AMP-binding protein [Moorena sp. SIOASIH]NEO35906.1 AMP-binding protein [Moorena sp. SIOASIH]
MSLVDLLGERAQAQPNQLAYIFLLDGETESGSLTYGELDAKARAIAAHLQSMQGERALLLYPSGLEFISAFMGCLYAGVVAVPVYPPRRNQKLSRLLNIVNDAQACIALTTTSILADIEQRWASDGELAQLKLIATDTIVADSQEFAPLSVTGSSLAFLQYTSGSTGTPKGVMVTHGNIIHNQQMIHQAFGHSEKTIFVGWLPLFHDMGLIGNVLQPMYLGIPCILMPPVAFLQKPIRWLKAISKYRATTSGGPNFAYDLCVKKIQPEQLANLDLSSWDVAFNGAEPVRAETLKQFGQKFANCGFNYRAFYPCYGMAETTLFATGGEKNQSPVIQGVKAKDLEQNLVVESEISSDESRGFVGVGRPYLNTTVIIVNPESLTPSEPGQVGEIWVSGGSVTSGYWNRPQATQEVLQAYLKDTGDGPFLRTGDLGFLLKGELFVTGRLKDMIIIRGRNYYPQDIELTVENSHPALRSHCSAAFSVERDGEERLVVACEVERTHLRKLNTEEVVSAVRHGIWMEHELKVYGVLLLKTGSIPKTSSGKIQRHACRQEWLNKQLNLVGEWIENELVEPITSEQRPDEYFPEKTTSFMPTQNNGHKVLTSQDTASQSRADELLEWLRDYASFRINSRLIDERRCIPPHIVLDLGNRGFFGLQVPFNYGGIGLNNVDTLRVIEQLGAIDQTLTLFVGNHNVLGVRPIMKYASLAQKEQLLPNLATGREIAAYALTEPGAGSNPRAISARAIPNPNGGWLLEGSKIWSGSAAWSSVINIFVQQLDPHGKPMGISGFVVPQRTKGLRIGPEALTMGMRGMVQNAIFLDGVSVTPEQLLSEAGAGMKVAQDAMMHGRLGLAAGCIGGMKRCAQLMLRYGERRSISTGRLLDNPVTLVRLSDLTAAITVLENLVFTTAELLDRGYSIPEEVYTACKTSGPEFFWQAADNLVQLLGGRGYIETNIAPQIYRDARVFRIFEGPTETLNMFLGSRVIQKPEELYQFLSKTLEVPEVAKRLKNATAEISDRLRNKSRFCEDHTALRWAYVCTGEVATWAILLAVVKRNLKQLSSEPLQIAATWAELQLEQKLQLVLMGTPAEMVESDAENITARIEDYAEKIGDIEQTLPGVDHELDEFLRQTSTVKSNKNLDVELIHYQETKKVAVEPKNYQPLENQEVYTYDQIGSWIKNWLAKQPGIQRETINRQTSFADYGMDSVLALELVQALEDWLQTSLDATILWNFPTIESLAQYLASMSTQEDDLETSPSGQEEAKTTTLELEKPLETQIETSIAEELVALENLLKGN